VKDQHPPDDLRHVISGRVTNAGVVNLQLPLRRFPKLFRDREFYKLPFIKDRQPLPAGFEAQPFLVEHFLSGARYVEEIFFRPWVDLDPVVLLKGISSE
jgi:hypothetical protein